MIIYRCEQRSPEWRQRKLGVLTASRADKLVTASGKLSAQWRRQALAPLIFERLTGLSADRDLSHIPEVRDGILREPDARLEFSRLTGLEVEQIGLVTTDDARFGCSPDGLIVGRNESLEIKCPTGGTQMSYLLDGLEDAYRPQVQMQLMVGGWDCVHFFAYHPNTPPFYMVTYPDPAFQAAMSLHLAQFATALEVETERARALGSYLRAPLLWEDDELIDFENDA